MKGVITGKDVFLHSVSIVRLWGLGTYLACVRAALARRPSTFLGTLYPAALPAPVAPRAGRPADRRG
ncbi:MAG TPA: hypothetical protein VML50_17710 [Anaeromyxobacter sp.]|nr:hypothetical protein [Anaeromyxobacter sp.]